MNVRIFRVWLVCCFLMSLVGASSKCVAGENYAFLVAVGDYDLKQLKPLRFTRNDIFDFHQVLLDSGYKAENVVLMHDDLPKLKGGRRYVPEADKIRLELGLLLAGLNRDDSVVVAFSGHGVEFQGEDKNYFCPADTDLSDRKKLVSLGEVYDRLKACPAQRKLLLVDACRNDPQTALGKGRDKVKLESLSRPQSEPIPKGIVALFSCSAGQESYEFTDLKHGIFFHHVLEGWKGAADGADGQLDLDELVAYTKKQTQTFTRLKLASIQTPQQRGEFDGTWVLRPRPVQPPVLLPKLITSSSTGMKLTLIPAGTFQMGSSAADVHAYLKADSKFKVEHLKPELPQHPVKISQPFYMGVHEVTQDEYEKVVGSNPSADSKTGVGRLRVEGQDTSKFPVENVSWYDAIEFCNKLSVKDSLPAYYTLTNPQRESGSIKSASVTMMGGKGYRLPTEAEWEYACRANTTTPFHFGSVLNGDKANVGIEPFGTTTKGKYLERTTTVGSYPANAFGLYDMHGNVFEWCFDMYDESAYKSRSGTTVDPLTTTGSEYRVLRGGNWLFPADFARSTFRFEGKIDVGNGFRVVCVGVRTP